MDQLKLKMKNDISKFCLDHESLRNWTLSLAAGCPEFYYGSGKLWWNFYYFLFFLLHMFIAVIDPDSGKMSPLVPSTVMFWLNKWQVQGHSAFKNPGH